LGGCEPVWSSVCLGVILGSSWGHLVVFLFSPYSASTVVPLLLDLDTKVCAVCYLHFHPAWRVGVSVVLSLYIPYHHAVFEALETRDSRLCINNISHTVVDPLCPNGCLGAENSPLTAVARAALIFLVSNTAGSSQLRRARSGPVVEPRSSLSWHRRTPSGEGPERVPYPRLPQDPCRSIPRCNPRTRLFQLEGNRGSPLFGIVYRPITPCFGLVS
jgi:hypothetical protein